MKNTIDPKNNTETSPKRKINRHSVIMVLGCLIPIAILGILWATGIRSNYLYFGIILLCPLLHVIMMTGMNKKDGNSNDHHH